MSVLNKAGAIPTFRYESIRCLIFCSRAMKKCDLFYLSANETVSKTNNIVATYLYWIFVFIFREMLVAYIRLSVGQSSCF